MSEGGFLPSGFGLGLGYRSCGISPAEGRTGEISRELCYEDILQFNMAAPTQTMKFSDIYDLKEELGK